MNISFYYNHILLLWISFYVNNVNSVAKRSHLICLDCCEILKESTFQWTLKKFFLSHNKEFVEVEKWFSGKNVCLRRRGKNSFRSVEGSLSPWYGIQSQNKLKAVFSNSRTRSSIWEGSRKGLKKLPNYPSS